ncbi:MAG: hypothetical protein QOE59_19 [Actinomycetota bacterium]|nr:hypothetical protein [Actinomycetota bacterium]
MTLLGSQDARRYRPAPADELDWLAAGNSSVPEGLDTAELFFDGCRVPVDNLAGELGARLYVSGHSLRERLSMAFRRSIPPNRPWPSPTAGSAQLRCPLGSRQALRFQLAVMRTEVGIARGFMDHCVEALLAGKLSAEDAAAAKYWTSDLVPPAGVRIERVLTDNALSYRRGRNWTAVCVGLGIRRRFIKPGCPWTNGKAERLNRTLLTEFAYARPWTSNHQRLAALDSWVTNYNTARAHCALGGQPPITRLAC